MSFLKGKLTYVMAAVAIVYGIFGSMTGTLDQDTALQIIWTGLAVFGLRRALPQ